VRHDGCLPSFLARNHAAHQGPRDRRSGMTRKPCIVVAGMGRCGTSLMMQMLDAMGVSCIGSWPDYETDHSSIAGFDAAWFSTLHGQAIKILDPTNLPALNMPNHVVVWMDRDPKEQAKSQVKFLRACGATNPSNGQTVRALAANLRKDRLHQRARLGLPGRCPEMCVCFETLITEPAAATQALVSFLAAHGWSGLYAPAAAAEVIARPPTCLPYFLEATLLLRGRQTA